MSLRQIPDMVLEFWELAKAYLIQETVVPAKQLGHFAGFSLGAAAAWAAAIILLAVASLRAIVNALPDGAYWEALGYLITVGALLILAAVIYRLGPQPHDDREAKEAS